MDKEWINDYTDYMAVCFSNLPIAYRYLLPLFFKKSIQDPEDTAQIENVNSYNEYENPCSLRTVIVYQNMWKGYERFLCIFNMLKKRKNRLTYGDMACKYPTSKGELFHPSFAIDLMWHAHMICPKAYPKEKIRGGRKEFDVL